MVDAKNEASKSFFRKYDFITVDDSRWPRKMFVPLATMRRMFDEA